MVKLLEGGLGFSVRIHEALGKVFTKYEHLKYLFKMTVLTNEKALNHWFEDRDNITMLRISRNRRGCLFVCVMYSMDLERETTIFHGGD